MWFEYHTQLISWSEDTMMKMEVVSNITERKISEKELRLSAAAFDTATEALMITNISNHIITKI